jgi:hypothetical protein
MALNSEGLPLGLELDAAAGRDRDLLALARRVEHVIGRVPGPTGFEAAGTPDVRAAALLSFTKVGLHQSLEILAPEGRLVNQFR